MDIFEAVKEQVTAREAAERYGIQVSRYGMAVCPFHQDKNPSLKLDRRFHCFGCGADQSCGQTVRAEKRRGGKEDRGRLRSALHPEPCISGGAIHGKADKAEKAGSAEPFQQCREEVFPDLL